MFKDSPIAAKAVAVLVPAPVERAYSYAVPDGMSVVAGSVVRVPLGARQVSGVVVGAAVDEVAAEKLRPVSAVFDCPPLLPELMRFIRFVADYTLSPAGQVARMALRVPAAFEPEAVVEGLRYSGGAPDRLTPARARVLERAADGMAWTRSGLAHAAGVSSTVIDGLKAQGILTSVPLPPVPVVPPPDPAYAPAVLETAQRDIADTMRQSVTARRFHVSLLDGVTGSGKTEVYFEAVAAALEQGRQVLILLPEIALTQQFLDRFEARFGAAPAEWHSDLTAVRRERIWRQVAEGRVRVVAGARSALFLPFADLGLIVVDEEHDAAYKQEDRVFYNARDMAVARGHIAGIPVILSSATPSVESQVNAHSGRYQRLHLGARFARAALPDLRAVDMRRTPPPPGKFLSPPLLGALRETLANGKQSLLFLNRRGYAPLTLCRVCGHRFACRNCSSWLVEHRSRRQLLCHHCGYHEPVPEACPECGTLDHLAACGPGVERIAEEAGQGFPEARVQVLSTDMAGGIKRLRLELEAIAKGEVDIIIGTQLVAKGHHFPHITLVGVVDADLGLANADPRAAERTFQLLSQVTGRAGRTGEKSLGLIQTYQPEHPVMQAIVAGDSAAFYQREIATREMSRLPPFGRLAALIISGENRMETENHARVLRRAAPVSAGITVLGPAEAPIAQLRGRYRFRLAVHGERKMDVQAYIRALVSQAPRPRGSLRVQVDIDPQSFL
ncbi:MAG: Primosomal protein N [Candidatus Tokpelaia hoelldobleri]|uniref:Replication restart protein PriA n=1 Tax=Candidatus Tokpelaia hoelldobleri TaxID=1902579 RepID=A0A1U9JT51_9HYPH|nr:MAG: Primosomal protein N [Candidatus Tokpelaia hoelldoblerii]